MLSSRKISASFVSEAFASTSNDPYGQGRWNPALKDLQQKILRLQVLQIVLGLTLMILSAVAIIEERIIFGLGFGLISALMTIFFSVLGIQQTNPKTLFLINMVILLSLIPAFNYTFLSLNNNISFRMGNPPLVDKVTSINTSSTGIIVTTPNEDIRRFTTTAWVLGWMELFHLIPLVASILYSSYFLKDIHFYQSSV